MKNRLIKGLLLTGAMTLMACQALAENFTLMVYETPAAIAKRTDKGPVGKAYWDSYNRFAEVLIKAGALRGGTALGGKSQKVMIKGKAYVLGGYFIIEAADELSAKTLAKSAPKDGIVEVRKAYPNPTMMTKN
jgi:hypothetical protein